MPEERVPEHQLPQPGLKGGAAWVWEETHVAARIYHADAGTPNGYTARPFLGYGRFDHHRPGPARMPDPDGRTTIYVGDLIETAVCEAIGRDDPYPGLCPNWRIAFVAPRGTDIVVQDFVRESPSGLGAPDDLGDGTWARIDTQTWARAIHYDRPAHGDVGGIRYWSHRHRGPLGERRGVNSVVWETAPGLHLATDPTPAEVSLRRIWPRVMVTAKGVGVYPSQISEAECPRCP